MLYHKKFIPKPIITITAEKLLIEKHFDFIRCKVQNETLYCFGKYQPTSESLMYSYKIEYNAKKTPSVTITNPNIPYNDDIHMYYEDNSLCLYHKSDLSWNISHHLYDTIIPWTHEWFVFYELYQFTGEWLHPYVPHKKLIKF